MRHKFAPYQNHVALLALRPEVDKRDRLSWTDLIAGSDSSEISHSRRRRAEIGPHGAPVGCTKGLLWQARVVKPIKRISIYLLADWLLPSFHDRPYLLPDPKLIPCWCQSHRLRHSRCWRSVLFRLAQTQPVLATVSSE